VFLLIVYAGWELNPLTKLIHFTKAELKHYAQNVSAVGLPGPITSVLSIFTQKYEGDITIKPLRIQLKSFQGLLSNPTSARVAAAIREGELETWKHLSIIKNHCDIEFTINECISTIKTQLQGDLLLRPFTAHVRFNSPARRGVVSCSGGGKGGTQEDAGGGPRAATRVLRRRHPGPRHGLLLLQLPARRERRRQRLIVILITPNSNNNNNNQLIIS
jgi:hypothetical protein